MAIIEYDTKTLIEAYKAGDQGAFDEIVRRHGGSLIAHARRRVGDPVLAEDIVQETLLRAYRALPRFNGQYRLDAWLHRILTNVCIDEQRRRLRSSALVDRIGSYADAIDTGVEEPASVDDGEELRVDLDRLHDALASIPAPYREALELRYGHQLSMREVAERTGVTEENARARVHRGRQALRKLLSVPSSALGLFVPWVRRDARPSLVGTAAAQAASPDTVVAAAQSAPVLTRLAVDLGPTLPAKIPVLASMITAASIAAVPAATQPVFDRQPAPVVVALAVTTTTPSLPSSVVAASTTVPKPVRAGAAVAAPAAPEPIAPAPPSTVVAVPIAAAPAAPAPPVAAPTTSVAAAAAPVVATTVVPTTVTLPPNLLPTTTVRTPPSTSAPTTVPAVGPASASGTLSGSLDGLQGSFSGSLQLSTSGGPIKASASVGVTITPGPTPEDPVRVDVNARVPLPDGSVATLRIATRASLTSLEQPLEISLAGSRYAAQGLDGHGVAASGGASGSLRIAGGALTLDATLS